MDSVVVAASKMENPSSSSSKCELVKEVNDVEASLVSVNTTTIKSPEEAANSCSNSKQLPQPTTAAGDSTNESSGDESEATFRNQADVAGAENKHNNNTAADEEEEFFNDEEENEEELRDKVDHANNKDAVSHLDIVDVDVGWLDEAEVEEVADIDGAFSSSYDSSKKKKQAPKQVPPPVTPTGGGGGGRGFSSPSNSPPPAARSSLAAAIIASAALHHQQQQEEEENDDECSSASAFGEDVREDDEEEFDNEMDRVEFEMSKEKALIKSASTATLVNAIINSGTLHPGDTATNPSSGNGGGSPSAMMAVGEVEEIPSCSICFEEYSVENPASASSCGHAFHFSCLVAWQQRSNNCPLCMGSVALVAPDSQAAPTTTSGGGGHRQQQQLDPEAFNEMHQMLTQYLESEEMRYQLERQISQQRRRRRHQRGDGGGGDPESPITSTSGGDGNSTRRHRRHGGREDVADDVSPVTAASTDTAGGGRRSSSRRGGGEDRPPRRSKSESRRDAAREKKKHTESKKEGGFFARMCGCVSGK